MYKPYGYLTSEGYMGYISDENRYQLFDTEQEYLEYITKQPSGIHARTLTFTSQFQHESCKKSTTFLKRDV